MDNTTLSAADVALLSRNDGFGGGFGDGGGIWLFALLFLFMAGGNGFGFGGNNQQFATRDQVQNGFDTQNMQMQTSGILNAVTNGTAQTIAASTANATNAINAIKDGNAALIREFGNVETALTALSGKQQECCCEILRGVDGVNYNGAINTANINAGIAQNRYEAALNTASINETTTAQTQKILDAISQSKIDSLEAKVQELSLQNSLAGVVRYPMNTMYGVPSPCFSGCGCGNI